MLVAHLCGRADAAMILNRFVALEKYQALEVESFRIFKLHARTPGEEVQNGRPRR